MLKTLSTKDTMGREEEIEALWSAPAPFFQQVRLQFYVVIIEKTGSEKARQEGSIEIVTVKEFLCYNHGIFFVSEGLPPETRNSEML